MWASNSVLLQSCKSPSGRKFDLLCLPAATDLKLEGLKETRQEGPIKPGDPVVVEVNADFRDLLAVSSYSIVYFQCSWTLAKTFRLIEGIETEELWLSAVSVKWRVGLILPGQSEVFGCASDEAEFDPSSMSQADWIRQANEYLAYDGSKSLDVFGIAVTDLTAALDPE